jgi:transposase
MGVSNAGKFTKERRERILGALRAGLPIRRAAGFAGISAQTLYNWLERGAKAPEGEYGKFAQAIEQAQAELTQEMLGHITRAAEDDWRASAHVLERRFPDEWGKKERHEVSGPAGEPIKIEVTWPGVPPE